MWEAEVEKTLALFAEKETEQTWGAFAADLQEWADRVAAAGAAAGVESDSAKAEREAMAQALARINGPVTQSMLSLRSALSTTTCGLVSAVAAALKREFDPLAEVIVGALLELAGRSNRIFVRAAETALKAVAEHCHALATKSASKRQVVSVAVVGVFAGCDDTLRRRYTDDVAEIAGLLLNDGDAKVRQTGKELYGALLGAWPDVAASVYARLDGNRQSALQSLRVDAGVEAADADKPAAAATAPKRAVPSAVSKPWLAPRMGSAPVDSGSVMTSSLAVEEPPRAHAPRDVREGRDEPREEARPRAAGAAVALPRQVQVQADPRTLAARLKAAPVPCWPAQASMSSSGVGADEAGSLGTFKRAIEQAGAATVAADDEPAPSDAGAVATWASASALLDPLLLVLVSAPLPERKDALEALASLLRERPEELVPPLVSRLRLQPASVRLPLGRLLHRRVPSFPPIPV